MEGNQYHNNENAAVVSAEGKPTSSNEDPYRATSTESADEPKRPYAPLGVWVKEVK